MHTHMPTLTNVYTQNPDTRILTHTHTNIHTHARTHTNTHTRTHTHILSYRL